MSINTETTPDRSTQGANWGTLVILLVVVIIGIVVAWTVIKGNQNPSLNAVPTLSNPTPQTVPAPAAAPANG